MQFRKFLVTASVLLALVAGLIGCGSDSDYSDESEYAQVCISNQTGTRVDDDMCEDTNGIPHQPWFVYGWYPVHYYAVPPIGGPVFYSHYRTTRPTDVTVKKAAPRGNAAPLLYSDAEKKKRRDAVAAQQKQWEKQQEKKSKTSWTQPPSRNGGSTTTRTPTGGTVRTGSSTRR